jgi:hypothetical protein
MSGRSIGGEGRLARRAAYIRADESIHDGCCVKRFRSAATENEVTKKPPLPGRAEGANHLMEATKQQV